MLAPAKPVDEAARQAGVEALAIVGTSREERFDRLVRLAARVLDCPLAAVSFIDGDREWFKAVHGFAATELPRDSSLGAHVILGSGPFVVPVLREDERYADHPLAARPGIASYAAVPIRGPNGGNVGVLAVMDRKAHRFNDEELRLLSDIGQLTEDELEVHQHHMAPRPPRPSAADAAPLRALLHAIGLPAAALDEQGHIRFVNDAWAAAAHAGSLIDPGDRVGTDLVHRLQDVKGFHQKDAERLSRALDEMIAGARDVVAFEHEVDEAPWEVEARRIDGGAIVVHRPKADENARREAEQALADAALQAEEWGAQDRFRRRQVERLEHEINTPMTPVRLQLPLLLTDRLGDLNERQRKAVESLVRNVQRWHDRTQELLALQREPRQKPRMTQVDLRAVVQEAVDLCKPLALQSGIKLHGPLRGGAVMVRADAELTRQVTTEIVEHALSQAGAGARIDVDVDGDDEGGDLVVRDPAAPRSPEEAARLFAPDPTHAVEPGGMRLPLCRRFVEQMGGTCQAFGEGDGTRIVVRLPAA